MWLLVFLEHFFLWSYNYFTFYYVLSYYYAWFSAFSYSFLLFLFLLAINLLQLQYESSTTIKIVFFGLFGIYMSFTQSFKVHEYLAFLCQKDHFKGWGLLPYFNFNMKVQLQLKMFFLSIWYLCVLYTKFQSTWVFGIFMPKGPF